jgi:hypothetical protein
VSANNIFKIPECKLVSLLLCKKPGTMEAVLYDNESIFVWALFMSLKKTFALEYNSNNCSLALGYAWLLRISAYKEKREEN